MQRQQTLANGARLLVSEAIREPVREAVRDALREEATVVRADDSAPNGAYPTGEEHSSGQAYPTDNVSDEGSQGGSAAGKLGVAVVGLLAVLGLTYVFRRRGGEESEPVEPRHADATARSGYGTETGAEYEGDEMGAPDEGAGHESPPAGDQ